MNSTRLQAFSKGFCALIASRDWPAKLGIGVKYLERGAALAQRQLFAETSEHPALAPRPVPQSGRHLLITRCWLLLFAVGLYGVNLLVVTTMVLRKLRWNGECGDGRVCALGPPGRGFDTYRTVIPTYGGIAICIVGPKSWRQASVRGEAHVFFETLLTTKPWLWVRQLLFLMGEVAFVSSTVVFESNDRAKSVARFLYVILKQATMTRRADDICTNVAATAAVLFSSEDLSLPLLEKLQAKGVHAIHHLHGIALQGDMTIEPPLADAVIVSCAREREIFSIYPSMKALVATIPFQMQGDLLRSRSIGAVEPAFEILVVASFELPFLQKETYRILSASLESFRGSTILLRHHPRVPVSSRRLLNETVPFSEISLHRDLVADVNRSRVVICCAVDPLVICLYMRKPTVFLPMTDGNYGEYTRPFKGRLDNLWCPDSAEAMRRDLSAALSMRGWHARADYDAVVAELVGGTNFDGFGSALGSILKRDAWLPAHAEGGHD